MAHRGGVLGQKDIFSCEKLIALRVVRTIMIVRGFARFTSSVEHILCRPVIAPMAEEYRVCGPALLSFRRG